MVLIVRRDATASSRKAKEPEGLTLFRAAPEALPLDGLLQQDLEAKPFLRNEIGSLGILGIPRVPLKAF